MIVSNGSWFETRPIHDFILKLFLSAMKPIPYNLIDHSIKFDLSDMLVIK